jgi:hypothetical protein
MPWSSCGALAWLPILQTNARIVARQFLPESRSVIGMGKGRPVFYTLRSARGAELILWGQGEQAARLLK